MGTQGSKIEKLLGPSFPESERFFGLENFGNTCYCNSVLQALYFCRPFRAALLQHHQDSSWSNRPASSSDDAMNTHGLQNNSHGPSNGINNGGGNGNSGPSFASHSSKSNSIGSSKVFNSTLNGANGSVGGPSVSLLTALGDLFQRIAKQKKKTGVVAPKQFIHQLRQCNELFNSNVHHDAQEFLIYLLNTITELLQDENKAATSTESPTSSANTSSSSIKGSGYSPKTWIEAIFEGILVNETKCLTCESVSCKEETFLDLSVDIEQNTSISACLRNFSSMETLGGECKYLCETCCCLQEAQKRMLVQRLPRVLALHLKRFKFMEKLQRHKKLTHRVVFPLELKLFDTSDGAVDADRLYDLFAVVIHVGSGPNHGHYIAVVKSHDRWLIFDDDCVKLMEEENMQSFFGCASSEVTSSESGYLLFYETRMVGSSTPTNWGNSVPTTTSEARPINPLS